MKQRGHHRDVVSVIEAAYAPTSSDEEWLNGVVAAIAPEANEGMGVCAYTYEAARESVQLDLFAGVDSLLSKETLMAATCALDGDFVARTFQATGFCFGSDDTPFDEFPAAAPLVSIGIHDMLIINAHLPSGTGVCLNAPLPTRRDPTCDERARYGRLAKHISAGWRLRSRCPAAVVPDRAQWVELVDARYRVVDAFEYGGHRYVLAMEDDVIDPHPAVLAPRERQIIEAAAAGHTNKVIAYELGLSDSTVRVLLARAARKLQVSTRRELVALHNAHAAHGRG